MLCLLSAVCFWSLTIYVCALFAILTVLPTFAKVLKIQAHRQEENYFSSNCHYGILTRKATFKLPFFWQHWWTTILNWSNWEKSKSTCIHKSKQILYMCKHNLLIHERTLSSNQLSFEVRQCYQIKRWLEFDITHFSWAWRNGKMCDM